LKLGMMLDSVGEGICKSRAGARPWPLITGAVCNRGNIGDTCWAVVLVEAGDTGLA